MIYTETANNGTERERERGERVPFLFLCTLSVHVITCAYKYGRRSHLSLSVFFPLCPLRERERRRFFWTKTKYLPSFLLFFSFTLCFFSLSPCLVFSPLCVLASSFRHIRMFFHPNIGQQGETTKERKKQSVMEEGWAERTIIWDPLALLRGAGQRGEKKKSLSRANAAAAAALNNAVGE